MKTSFIVRNDPIFFIYKNSLYYYVHDGFGFGERNEGQASLLDFLGLLDGG